jgi:hypothetical protein
MSTGNTQLVGRLVTAGCMVLIYCKRKVLLVGSNTWQDIGLCCSVVVVIIYYCNVGNPLAFAMGRYPSSQLLHTGGSTPVLWHQKLVLHFASLHSREKWAPECHGQPVVDRIFVASDPSGSPFTFAFTTSKMSSCHVRPASLLWCNPLAMQPVMVKVAISCKQCVGIR